MDAKPNHDDGSQRAEVMRGGRRLVSVPLVTVVAAWLSVCLGCPASAHAGSRDCRALRSHMTQLSAELTRKNTDPKKAKELFDKVSAMLALCLNDSNNDGTPDDAEPLAQRARRKLRKLEAIPNAHHKRPHYGCSGLKGGDLCVRNEQCIDGICGDNGRCAVGARGIGCPRPGGDGSGCHAPGHCTRAVNERLHKKYHETCDQRSKRVTKSGSRACNKNDSCEDLKIKLEINMQCKEERLASMNGCYLGGDVAHKKAVEAVRATITNCEKLIPRVCDPD